MSIGLEPPAPVMPERPINWISDEEMLEVVQSETMTVQEYLYQQAAIQQLISQRECLNKTLIESINCLKLWMRRARLGDQLLKNLVGGNSGR